MQRALDQCFGGGCTVFCQNTFLNRTRIDPDADRNITRTSGLHDRFHAVFPANITGIEADFIHTGGNRIQRKPVIKMDIRDDRNGRLFTDNFERTRCRLVGHGTAHNVTACRSQCANLFQCRLCVASVGVGHRLHRHRCTTANLNRTNRNLSRLFLHVGIPPQQLKQTQDILTGYIQNECEQRTQTSQINIPFQFGVKWLAPQTFDQQK